MSQVAAVRHKTSFRQETGTYVPRQFTASTRYRFLLDRRRSYLARISGQPSGGQTAMAQSLATLEWAALKAEQENTLQSLREAREHRRLLLRVLADFDRSLATSAAPAEDPIAAVKRELAEAAARREAAEAGD